MSISNVTPEGLIRSGWNVDGGEWSPNDEGERHETFHELDDAENVVLTIYRKWQKDEAFWRPGQLGYAARPDAGLNNMSVRDVIIPENVHREILEVARELSKSRGVRIEEETVAAPEPKKAESKGRSRKKKES